MKQRASATRQGRPAQNGRRRGPQGWRRSKPPRQGALLVAPSVILLFIWMIVPAGDDALFLDAALQPARSRQHQLRRACELHLVPLRSQISSPRSSTRSSSSSPCSSSASCGGILVALLMDQPVFGQNVLRLMVIAPFFVMPTVSALVWKNLLMNPDSGLFAWIAKSLGFSADRLVHQLADAVGRSSSSPGNGCRSRASSS